MIAVVGVSKDEADIAERWATHTFATGADAIYLADASSDGTDEILRGFGVQVVRDDDEFCHQTEWTNRLAIRAAQDRADWIVALDLDEFVYAPAHETMAHALRNCPHARLDMPVYGHRDLEYRYVPAKMPKVAFRWVPGSVISLGNHRVTIPGDPPAVGGVLEIRELQYRSEAHFIAKVNARNATLPPEFRTSKGVGSHHRRLEGWSDEELAAEYHRQCALPTVYDPVPLLTTTV